MNNLHLIGVEPEYAARLQKHCEEQQAQQKVEWKVLPLHRKVMYYADSIVSVLAALGGAIIGCFTTAIRCMEDDFVFILAILSPLIIVFLLGLVLLLK